MARKWKKKRRKAEGEASSPTEAVRPEAETSEEETASDEELEVTVLDGREEELLASDESSGEDGNSGGGVGSKAATKAAALVPASPRGLARFDPMQAYINEARRYPLLTPEEEHDLAVRYAEHGDLEAARHMVTANLRLVVKIAHEYRKAYRNLLDLVQEGNIGLMHAVKKFDPYRGVKLSSYAAWWIRAYILKFVLNNWRMVKIGTTQAQRKIFFNLRKEQDRLKAMGIDNPEPKLLAERMDVSVEEVRSMQNRLAGSDVSLDAPLKNDESGTASRLDFVSAGEPGPDQQVADSQFSQLLQEKIEIFGKTLKGRDKEIFELRTVAEEPLTLQELGDRYGITRERARQVERRMMDRLRDYLREELGDAVNVALGISE